VNHARRFVGGRLLDLSWFLRRASRRSYSLLVSGAFAEFGAGSVLERPVRLVGTDRITLGRDVFVGANTWLHVLSDHPDGELAIGDGTNIAGSCVLSAASSVRLGRGVLLARNVYVSDHIHAYDDIGTPVLAQGVTRVEPVSIGDGAWLGQGVVVCPGVTIGRGAVVGANAVVLDDIPEFSLAVGVPARVVRRFGWRDAPS
jgi:lipopolysaccharide O-acetyltransferase